MEVLGRTEIYAISQSCDQVFRRITNNPTARSLVVTEVLYDQFSQWATHLGVFARDVNRPKVSLDARLRFSESLRSLVLQYLAIVERNLNHSKYPRS
jgi:hypothetical protein